MLGGVEMFINDSVCGRGRSSAQCLLAAGQIGFFSGRRPAPNRRSQRVPLSTAVKASLENVASWQTDVLGEMAAVKCYPFSATTYTYIHAHKHTYVMYRYQCLFLPKDVVSETRMAFHN